MKRRRMVAIGVVLYLVGMAAMAPAGLVDAGLQARSDGRLRLTDAGGTLWSGSGQIELRDTAGRRGAAKGISWRVMPESLWRGRLVCEVIAEGAAQPIEVSISPSAIDLPRAEIELPAALLGLVLPRLLPLGLSGDLLLQVSGLSLRPEQVVGRLTVQWRDAASALSPIAPLGAYELALDLGQGGGQALLHTLKGPLQLDGSSSWRQGAKSEFVATAQVPLQHRQQLGPLLGLIALERSAGIFELRIN